MGKLKTLDLFAGIGGFTLGLSKTNLYETVAFCEWDNKAKKVLEKNFPSVFCYGDIKDLSYEGGNLSSEKDQFSQATDIDVITGGFPCQDISYAGKGTGLEGDRSNHWYEYLRLISEIKPKGVIIENVSALRTRGLETVLKGLYSVGYDAEWHCIPASYTGSPHQRDRIWILAYSTGVRQQEPWGCLKSICTKKEVYREADRFVYAFQRGSLPYLCGGHDGFSKGLDTSERLKQLGNSVCWPVVEQLGYHLHENLKRIGHVK